VYLSRTVKVPIDWLGGCLCNQMADPLLDKPLAWVAARSGSSDVFFVSLER